MKKLTDIFLPISFKSIDTSNMNVAEIREIIKDNDKQIVLVKDTHYSSGNIEYVLGQIKEVDGDTYSLQLPNQKEPKRLCYDDLQSVLVPHGNKIKANLSKW